MSKKLVPVTYNNERILTTEQLAEIYETDINNVQANFKNHKDRFEKGKHYYLLQGDELKAFKSHLNNIQTPIVSKFTSTLYLWTERGADRHCKILDTDMAWKQFDNLERTYFMVKENKIKYKLPKNFSEALRQLADEVDENNRLKDNIKVMKPKADYTERILKNPGLVSISQISKDYGMSGVEMNKLLHNLKVQYKKSGQWLLYSKYDGKGYVHSDTVDITHKDGREDVKMNTKWTQAGRLFLYNLLKSKNVLPLIETQQQVMELGRN
jgi:phage antirepressor YoqD-like protein